MSRTRCRHQIPGATVQVRAEGDAPRLLSGYAAIFDSWTTLYRSKWWEVREVIRPGAFRNALSENQDVRALFNHDPDNVLGRTVSGTLRLSEDSRGLHMEVDPPDTELGRSVTEMIRRGDVSQMSFAFLPRAGGEVVTTRQEGDVEITEVEIKDVDLYDVAPVTYPAYKDTTIGLRGLTPAVADRFKREKDRWLGEARARSQELARRLSRA